MHAERFSKLMAFYQQDPSDPFVVYGLAMELKATQANEAQKFFDELLDKHPHYVPSYYHAAENLIALNRIEDAKAVYEKGLQICEQSGEAHALKELRNAYQNFLFEYEL
jgi:tetratricopeptide (TPR) repeat protein